MTRCEFMVQTENGGRVRKCKRKGYAIDGLGNQFTFCYQHWDILHCKLTAAYEPPEDDSDYDASCEEYASDNASNSTCCSNHDELMPEMEAFEETSVEPVPTQSSDSNFTFKHIIVFMLMYLAGVYTMFYMQDTPKNNYLELPQPETKLSLPKFTLAAPPQISIKPMITSIPMVLNSTPIFNFQEFHSHPYISFQPMKSIFGF